MDEGLPGVEWSCLGTAPPPKEAFVSHATHANAALTPLSDGLLILRFLFGFTGTTLTSGAIGANATRTDPAAIAAFMSQFNP